MTEPRPTGDARAAWDRRLLDGLAHEAWLAANRPDARPRSLPLRTQIASPWFWLSLVPLVAVLLVSVLTDPHGWAAALVWVLYVAALPLVGLIQRWTRAP
jgi:hypothetical protein